MRQTLLAVCALAVTSTPAHGKVVEIAPSSPWNVDFGEEKCRLARFFGEEGDKHLLLIEQYWPGESVGMTVAGSSYARYGSREKTELRFSAAQPPVDTKPFTGKIGDFGDGVVYSTIKVGASLNTLGGENSILPSRMRTLDKDAAQKVEFVSLRQRGDEIRLMTGPLDQAFEVLNQCSVDLIGTWGLDVEQHRTATRMPVWTNRNEIVRRIVAYYPRNALIAGEEGIMRMRVIVDTEGKVEDCVIIKASKNDRLNSPACRAMSEARFTPALDAAGQPMRSFFVESIVYQVGR